MLVVEDEEEEYIMNKLIVSVKEGSFGSHSKKTGIKISSLALCVISG